MPRRRVADPSQLNLFDDPPPVNAPAVPPPPPRDEAPPAPPADRAPAPAAPAVDPAAGDAPWHHPQADRGIELAGHRVDFRLRRMRRRSIGFVVGAEGLSVAAPAWVSIDDIEAALAAKARWIVAKLSEQAERLQRLDAARVAWRDGACIPYLGEALVVVLDPGVRGVRLDPLPTPVQAPLAGIATRSLRVGLPHGAQPEAIRKAVQGWLQREARRLFAERCERYAAELGVRWTRLGLSSARTRWGSASASGAIRLNWRLVHFDLETIDYVVAHELAHLREMNHSPRFWEVVRSVLPDYERARRQLKSRVLPVFD